MSIESVRARGGALVVAGFAALCHCSEKYGTIDAQPKDGGLADSSSSTPPQDSGGSAPNDAAAPSDAAPASDADSGAVQLPVPVSLATALNNPSGIALDESYVYITERGADRVQRYPKLGGTVEILATQQPSATGLFVQSGSLFWANRTFPPGGDPQFKGGIWTCVIVDCPSSTKLLRAADWPQNPVPHKDRIFFPADNDFTIESMLVDGGSHQTLHSIEHPFSIALDDTHVYFNSNLNTLKRILHDGGSVEDVGPHLVEFYGYVAVDAERFYWAYGSPNNIGHVYGARKSAPGERIEFGTDNKRGAGVAVDATRIYWIDAGTGVNGVADQNGRLLSCPKSGCVGSPTVLASGLRYGGAIALDEDFVYFIESGNVSSANGAVWKVKKL